MAAALAGASANDPTDYKKTVSAVTPEKVAAYLKTLSGAGNRIEVVMLPEK